mgnify:CR=1 FL=1
MVVNGVIQEVFGAEGKKLNKSTSLSLNNNNIITIRNVSTIPNSAILRAGLIGAYVLFIKLFSILLNYICFLA